MSVAIGLALSSGTIRLPAAPCLVTNTPSEKACEGGCCANKHCCETSQQRTGPPVQPFAKSGADIYNVAALPTILAAPLVAESPAKCQVLRSAKRIATSRPTLPLLCTCLI